MSVNNSVKCVAVGDGFVGKTTLLMRLTQNEIDLEDYSPTVFDNHSLTYNHNGQSFDVALFDTAGQEEYNLLRKQVYDSTDVFLVCFAVSNTDSFSHVKELWLREIEECPNASKILIGTKSDLRNDPETIDKLNANGGIFVTKAVAKNFADSHKMKYIECSSLKQENTQEILKAVVEVHSNRSSVSPLSSANPCCCVHPVLQLAKRMLCCKNNY